MKHLLKTKLREAYARVLFHTGLHAVVDGLMPRRLTILAGHCVGDPAANGVLPPDMTISSAKLERMLRWLQRRYDLRTVSDGWRALRAGEGGNGLLALSMDDGYRDNATALLPLLRKLDVPATIYLETRPLDERRVNWTHKYFWITNRLGNQEFLDRYRLHCHKKQRQSVLEVLEAMVRPGFKFDYHFKRFLKYQADPEDRDRTLDVLFTELEGDERALCDELYMDWDDARQLRDGGCELGCHTRSHAILSRIAGEELEAETAGAAADMRAALGARTATFAYPFGRLWDFDDASVAAVREASFDAAVTTDAGTNGPADDPHRLRRLMIDDGAKLHLIVAEACGGFELLRRFGLDLSK